MASSDHLRIRWREYCHRIDRYHRACEAWQNLPYAIQQQTHNPQWPDGGFPEELRSLTCGTNTRAGTPCKLTSIYENGRCKIHGGLSTGPTSAAGKRKAALNGFRPKKKRTPMKVYKKTKIWFDLGKNPDTNSHSGFRFSRSDIPDY